MKERKREKQMKGIVLSVVFASICLLLTLQALKTSIQPRRISFALNGQKRFCVNVNLHIKPERREEFIRVILQNQKGTMTNEPLAKQYDWGESVISPNTFHFQEKYLGKEGFEAHQKSEHFRIWKQFAGDDANSPFSRPPEVFLFEEFVEE